MLLYSPNRCSHRTCKPIQPQICYKHISKTEILQRKKRWVQLPNKNWSNKCNKLTHSYQACSQSKSIQDRETIQICRALTPWITFRKLNWMAAKTSWSQIARIVCTLTIQIVLEATSSKTSERLIQKWHMVGMKDKARLYKSLQEPSSNFKRRTAQASARIKDKPRRDQQICPIKSKWLICYYLREKLTSW